jgi:site-specific DNA-methyltransferase (cytosine-N4-specific)
MIGNREITGKIRRDYWERFGSDRNQSPASIRSLISKINDLNDSSTAGFRRRNLPSLLYKYFDDMRMVFSGMQRVLKPRASAFVVVGNNHTIAGGLKVEIETVKLLSDLAQTVGLELIEEIPMEMLVSRDIFKKNAIESESILHFRKSTSSMVAPTLL